MRRSRKFLLASVFLLVLFSLSCWAEGGVTLSESEFQTLRTALIQADEQLTRSEQEIDSLQSLLNEQDSRLATLMTQLDEASQSLRKLKTEATWNSIKMVVIGVAGFALGGFSAWLLMGGLNAHN